VVHTNISLHTTTVGNKNRIHHSSAADFEANALATSLENIASLQGTLPLDPPATMSVNTTTTTNASSNGLKGVAPTIFTGDQSKSKTFLNEFRRYRLLNKNNDTISIPFYRVLTALSYIKGPLVEDWVNARDQEFVESTNPANMGYLAESDETLWNNFERSFKSTWQDNGRKQTTYDQLMKLTMRDLDIDTYTATFE
jgi:hypothetical protein